MTARCDPKLVPRTGDRRTVCSAGPQIVDVQRTLGLADKLLNGMLVDGRGPVRGDLVFQAEPFEDGVRLYAAGQKASSFCRFWFCGDSLSTTGISSEPRTRLFVEDSARLQLKKLGLINVRLTLGPNRHMDV